MKLIVPPRKYPDAIPTHRGWEFDGEVVEARALEQGQIDAYMQAKNPAPAPQPAPAPAPQPAPEPTPQPEPVAEPEPEEEETDELDIQYLLRMTKEEIELVGRKYGIELDRRNTKENMIEELLDFVEE
jgi:hypothetical protein